MIAIVVTCYERPHLAERTIRSLHGRLYAGSEQLHVHIADDGSSDVSYASELCDKKLADSVSVANRRGVGGSLNEALLYLRTALGDLIWLYTTDDWLLTEPYDITQAIKLVRDGYDYVRLGPIHPNLHCITKFNQQRGWWLEIDHLYGGFAFATRPFVTTLDFYDKLGPFAEYEDAYVTERDYADRCLQHTDLKMAAILSHDALHGPWQHIGPEDSVGKITPPRPAHA